MQRGLDGAGRGEKLGLNSSHSTARIRSVRQLRQCDVSPAGPGDDRALAGAHADVAAMGANRHRSVGLIDGNVASSIADIERSGTSLQRHVAAIVLHHPAADHPDVDIAAESLSLEAVALQGTERNVSASGSCQ